jgi:3-oxoacyl-[acyl-carrier protein] reductase
MSKYTAVITGGSKGIGADLGQRLIAKGYDVVSLSRGAPEWSDAKLQHVEVDLLDGLATEQAAAEIAAQHNVTLILLQAFLPSMKMHNFGRVMFNGSRAALGVPTRTAYAATKAGIIGMARTWALELAPHGITVNVVSPGPVQTDNFWDIIPKGSTREADLAKRIPVGRLGRVQDISNAFLFFCDPDNGFVTGQNLYVCGGGSVGALSL